jgi:FkbM family methyltransferase
MNRLKLLIRLLEARMTPRKSVIRFNGHDIRLIRSIWWNDAEQPNFNAEIIPYFQSLSPSTEPLVIVDAGAACGLFSLAICFFYPTAKVWAFEPSERQRILLARNLKINRMDSRIRITSLALWNYKDCKSFRTHGSMSSLREVSGLPSYLAFTESVQTVPLYEWFKRSKLRRLDLIKMDIEGAEIEALEGASELLQQHHPRLLIQAYHQRDGVRTFERCAKYLTSYGYQCRELKPESGLLEASA